MNAERFSWSNADVELLDENDELLMDRFLGGSGSGNFGHEGRPGEVGGSASGGATAGFRDPSSAEDKQRLKDLKIPPAWKNVRLNPNPNGALQAVGTDVKGRTQYRYSAEHSAEAAAEKFARLQEFNEALPSLREKISEDLSSDDPDTREAASVLYMIDKTGFRIGSDSDTGADKKAFGASTMLAKHVKVNGDKTTFKFTGKKGVQVRKTVEDEQLAQILSERKEQGGRLFSTSDKKVRDYMSSRAKGFSPKDFRTWHGTAEALKAISKMPKPKDAKAFKASQKKVGKIVSDFLGNTPTVALASYIDPAVFSKWRDK